ncbi:MAG: hypothetical protein KAJ49_10555 [Arcobacteraceae bacterium]|nr:hypothetical protein [Arcobacteraceae bacterium]
MKIKTLRLSIVVISTLSLVLAGCDGAGSGGGSTPTTITAVDGYIKNATVKDAIGQTATYSSNGKYIFSSSPTYPLTLAVGSLEDTNASFDINMSVSDGISTVISPITTFLGNSDTLRGKLTNAGFGNFTTLASFAVDYVDSNDTNLSKLSQLLYTILRDTNLTTTFKQSVENNGSLDSLDKVFSLALRDVNASTTLSIQDKLRTNSLLSKTKTFTGSTSNMENYLKAYKNNLNTTSDANITHNGTTYGTVMSPYTGKIWLDRNLGASQVCSSFDDEACYGDYYQWGRNHDGHQESNSTTTITLAIDISSAGNSFIISNNNFPSPNDWLENDNNNDLVDDNGSIRSANWSKIDGSSVCPVGFRVPTSSELNSEQNIKRTGGTFHGTIDPDTGIATGWTDPIVFTVDNPFNSFLKWSSSGHRSGSSGSINSQGSEVSVWSSSYSSNVNLNSYSFGMSVLSIGSSHGQQIRCIKD